MTGAIILAGLIAASCSAPHEDPVASFVREKMQPASAAFFIPSPVHRGEPIEAVLQVSAPKLSPAELQAELSRFSERTGVGASDSIRIASRMIATLVSDRECTITPKDPADQAIDLSQGTTWRWTVTPRARGETRVTVTLTAPMTVNGRETSYRIATFEKTVTVSVTRSDLVSDVLAWTKDYWVILTAAGGGLVALFEWLRRKRLKRRRAGFS
jgi:hypothetical protein